MKTLKTVTATRFTGHVLTVGAAAPQGTCVSGDKQVFTNAQPTHTSQVNPACTTDQQVPTKRTSAVNDVSVPHLQGSSA